MNTPRIKRQYVWEKTGGRCWYCGARLYYREAVDTEVKKPLVFTADHLHPRAHGGRGRANKVPACKYCNSHKGSRSIEQFRQWVQELVFDQAKGDGAPLGKQGLRRWKIRGGAVVFYFEFARLSNSGSQLPDAAPEVAISELNKSLEDCKIAERLNRQSPAAAALASHLDQSCSNAKSARDRAIWLRQEHSDQGYE